MVVFDPRWSRVKLARVGLELSQAWLASNGIALPGRVFFSREEANKARRKMLHPRWMGVYQRAWEGGWSGIAVSPEDCVVAQRAKSPELGRFWNAPGYAQDFTPLGVVCHEVGHHVDYTLDPTAVSRKKPFKALVEGEEEVSIVEYNVLESFAEAIRLFVTNPELLRSARPDRWDFLTKGLGLRPLHGTCWRVVLQKCCPRLKAAAERWVGEGEWRDSDVRISSMVG